MTGDIPVFDASLTATAIAAELERRRRRVATGAAQAVHATIPALAWTLGGGRFAVPLSDIRGVSGPVRTTAVPGAPPQLIGVFGRRGVIHTLFDPAQALGMAATGGAGMGAVILLRQDRPRIAIRADAATGVIDLPAGPEPGDAPVRPLVRTLVRTLVLADGDTVSVVDMGRLIGHLTGQTSVPLPEG